jgi:glucoamylase
MVLFGARYLVMHGPATPQERWEKNSGYSPSTLASIITALVCAACWARERGDEPTARFLEEYADFVEAHVEIWTVAQNGTLVPGISRHYVRINPVNINDPESCSYDEGPDGRIVSVRNRAPGTRTDFPAAEIVDAGFLELVRYGIRKPGDPLIEESLKVVDAALKVDFPGGPCWRRYTHDGYGQRDDGGAFEGWGTGRPWPLLTGERGHYELAAGRDPRGFIRALENFATLTRLLPEQIWDLPDRPDSLMYFGKPTGAAMPLMWAHAEYIKLVRSAQDGEVFDRVPEVASRYRCLRKGPVVEIWKSSRQIAAIDPGTKLRIIAPEAFILRWTADEWQSSAQIASSATALSLHSVDIPLTLNGPAPIHFTFFWTENGRWEGRDYTVAIRTGGH